MTIRRAVFGAVVALAALLGGGAAPASAHPIPIQATPEAGVVTQKASTSVAIALTEPVVARGSRVRILGPTGKPVAVGPLSTSGGGRVLSVKPQQDLERGIYQVRWSALGDDGHVVNGSFRFGVAGPNGEAPAGVETLTGAGERLAADDSPRDSVVQVLGRWLGILAASVLLGSLLLVRRLRRDGAFDESAARRVTRLAPVAWALVAVAAIEGVISAATSGAGGALDPRLLVTAATAVSDLTRLIIVALIPLLIFVVRRSGNWAVELVYLAGAFGVLSTYAISGHALSEPTWSYLLLVLAHVLTAAVWLGGVGAVALAITRAGIDFRTALRTYTPVAVYALAGAILTGALAAVREVDHWYFLRWSDYGRVVLLKSLFVGAVVLVGVIAWRRSRSEQSGASASIHRLLRIEFVGALIVLVFAATLPGLVQGREQPLPAQRDSLFAGPAFATALLGRTDAAVGLAPARTGANVLTVGTVPEQVIPKRVSVRLSCASCGVRPRDIDLRRHGGRTWAAPVDVAVDGRWSARVLVDGQPATTVQLQVGVPHAPGAPAINVLAVADLSGPAAERCRAHIIGLELALARVNADGGLDGGRKVVPLVLDSGGTAAGAARAAERGLAANPIASAGTCGDGGVAAARAVSRAGLPSVVGDPAVDPTTSRGVYRLAADPYVQGLGIGQLVRGRILPTSEPGVRVVRAAVADDLQGKRFLAGLRAGLLATSAPPGFPAVDGPGPQLVVLPAGTVGGLGDEELIDTLDRRQTSALVIDGPQAGGADTRAIERIGAERGEDLVPAPVLLSERALSETVVRAAGTLGRLGAVQGVSEVSTNSRDAELYQLAVPQLFRGEIASLDGLRGYATGLALRDALRDGTSADDIEWSLRSPRVFTNSLLAPWSPRAPGAGSPSVVALQPQFIAPTLVPASAGGEAKDTEYFPQGGWTVTTPTPLGIVPGLAQPEVSTASLSLSTPLTWHSPQMSP